MRMEDWIRVLLSKHESKGLDYKGPCDWKGKKDKKTSCELVKDIMAMANTDGGKIVIGVTDGVFELVGLDDEQFNSFDSTKINNFVAQYTEPSINTKTIPLNHDGKRFVIVDVPQFKDTPHVCKQGYKDSETGKDVLISPSIYVRTDNNASEPLKTSADFRKIVETAIRNRKDDLLSSFRNILEGKVLESEPSHVEKFEAQIKESRDKWDKLAPKTDYVFNETIFIPAHFEDKRYRLEELKEMSIKGGIDFRGWPYMFVNHNNNQQTRAVDDGYETLLVDDNDKHIRLLWHLRQSGLLYIKQVALDVRDNPWKKGEAILSFDGFCMNMAEALVCLTRLYEGNIDESEEVELRLTLINVMDVPLGSANPSRAMYPDWHICRSETIQYKQRRTFLDWMTGIEDHALEMCKYVYQRFNWEDPNLYECRKVIEDMMGKGPRRY